MTRTARLSIVCTLAALATPAAAWAHATLVGTSPANGAVLARAPHAIVVTFDDTVRIGSGNTVVANATKQDVMLGSARTHGRTLTIPLRAQLADGDYSARWSIVSDDGHREQGVIAFAVGAGRPSPISVLTAGASLGWWAAAFRLLFYLGLLTAGGVAVFALRVRGAGTTRVAHVLFVCLFAAFLGASGAVHAAASGTRNALVLDIALGLSLAGAAAAALAPREKRLLPVACACSLALLATPTFSGHALDRNQPKWFSIPADLAHVGGAAVWLGGLVALLAIVPHIDARADATRRISAAAFAAVPVLAAGGLLRAATELTAVHQAWSTSYGRALLVKTALFLPLLALGRLNRTRVALPRVRVEVVLIAVVIAAVAVLVQLKPGRDVTPACAAPTLPPQNAVVDAGEFGDLAVGIARGADETTVTLLGPDGLGANGHRVEVNGAAASPCGAGSYRAAPTIGPLRVTVDGDTRTFTVSPSAPNATGLLEKVTKAFRSSTSIVFDEALRSGPNGGIVTRFTVKAPHELGYVIRGGAQAVVIGAHRWDRDTPNGRWVQSGQTPLPVTRPYWQKPTNVHLVAPNTITFLDRVIPAWFRVTIGARNRPSRLHMTAAAHFMTDRYVGFDVPVTLSPPSR